MSEQRRSATAFGWLWLALPAILLFAAAPLLSVAIASVIAESGGCTLHEGSANVCIINGADMGPTLYRMFVAGWFSFVTLPIGLFALLAWAAAFLVLWLRRKPRNAQST